MKKKNVIYRAVGWLTARLGWLKTHAAIYIEVEQIALKTFSENDGAPEIYPRTRWTSSLFSFCIVRVFCIHLDHA